MKKLWQQREQSRPPTSGLLSQYPSFIAELLVERGVTDTKQARDFFEPEYESFFDPFLLKDMDRAVERIGQALEGGEKITIYADYDADAVTAAAVLLRFFQRIGYQEIDYYIPNRFSEGYGVNVSAVEELVKSGTKLIITVDTGITAFAAVGRAQELGVDVAVTDHHQVQEALPKSSAVVNPHRKDDQYPFKDLTGVGVAFKLVQALGKRMEIENWELKIPLGYEKWLLDLVAIGTVADYQSLLGENRIFVKWGLEVLKKTKWLGLQELIKLVGAKVKEINTYTVGFMIAPRLNAAGRLEHASTALELLLTEDRERAKSLASKLDQLNQRRQNLTEQILSEAREQALGQQSSKILFAVGEGWPKGILGLVAGNLTEEFHKPAFVLELSEGKASGSARSIPKFNVVEALRDSHDLFFTYGGHPSAAGFSLTAGQVALLRENLQRYAEEKLTDDDLRPVVIYDAEIKLSEVTRDLVELVEKFAPFGQGNPRPRFRFNDLQVHESRVIGQDGKHLRLVVKEGDVMMNCVGFGFGYWGSRLNESVRIDMIAEVGLNHWNGESRRQLKIVDLKLSQS